MESKIIKIIFIFVNFLIINLIDNDLFLWFLNYLIDSQYYWKIWDYHNLNFIFKIQCYLVQVISYLIKVLVFLKVLYILYYSMIFGGCLNHKFKLNLSLNLNSYFEYFNGHWFMRISIITITSKITNLSNY